MAQHQVTSSAPKTTGGPLMKYSMEHYRKEGVSEEAFMDWFFNVLLPKALPVMKKHNIVKYVVVSLPDNHPDTGELANKICGLF